MAEPEKAQQPPPYEEVAGPERLDIGGISSTNVITHLKLLSVFSKLRDDVMSDQNIFGFDDSWLSESQTHGPDVVSKARQLVAQKRWDVFVKRAAWRFESWWLKLRGDRFGNDRIRIRHLTNATPVSLHSEKDKSMPIITADNLPPLDVLMVWHSFLLSPRHYLEDCLLQGMMALWHTEFPWAAIDQVIEPLIQLETDTSYSEARVKLSAEAVTLTRGATLSNIIQCPKCVNPSTEIKPPFTTFDQDMKKIRELDIAGSLNDAGLLDHIQKALTESQGFADANFCVQCPRCRHLIDRDALCVQKFVQDVMRFKLDRQEGTFSASLIGGCVPMPGTILSSRSGLPQTFPTSRPSELVGHVEFFPNIFAATLRNVDQANRFTNSPSFSSSSSGLRLELEAALSCKPQMQYATLKRQTRAAKAQRQQIRKMMSYYNDNPSLFTLDLASAVHRQGNFIQKMQQIDWLHSPALSLTADRVITKYQRFMTVIAEYPKDMAVPTLDVDLAWHTHQLSPRPYSEYTIKQTGKLVDHDDKISEQRISESFARTSKNYQRLFNEPYSECTCWYCEAIHATVASFPGRFMLPGRATGYRRPPHPCNNDEHSNNTSAHISTHNAVKLQNAPTSYAKKCQEHLRWLDKAYQRACERAKKEGRAPPARRHRAQEDHTQANDPNMFQWPASGGKGGKVLIAGAAGVGLVGAGVIVTGIAIDGDTIDFEGNSEVINTHTSGGGGGCVGGACGGGVAWGGCAGDGGGSTGACGGGGSDGGAGGGDGGGSSGCGGCGGGG